MDSLFVSGSNVRLHQRDFIEVINILYKEDSTPKQTDRKVRTYFENEKPLPTRVRRITLKHSFRPDVDKDDVIDKKNNLTASQEKLENERKVYSFNGNHTASKTFDLNRKRSQSLPRMKKINNDNIIIGTRTNTCSKQTPSLVNKNNNFDNHDFVTSAVEWRKKMAEYQEEIFRLRKRIRQQDDVIERNKQQVS